MSGELPPEPKAPEVEPPALDPDGYGPQAPGSASVSADDEEDNGPEPGARIKVAHYGDMTEKEADELWTQETLCLRCMVSPMCKVAEGTRESLVVVSRCLAYMPVPG